MEKSSSIRNTGVLFNTGELYVTQRVRKPNVTRNVHDSLRKLAKISDEISMDILHTAREKSGRNGMPKIGLGRSFVEKTEPGVTTQKT